MSEKSRIIITGSRFWDDEIVIAYAIEKARLQYGFDCTIIQGECPYGGADLLAKEYAQHRGYNYESFYPDRDKSGKILGPQRNSRMLAEGGNVLLAFPYPNSRGTLDTIKKAKSIGIPIKTYTTDFSINGPDVEPNSCVPLLKFHFTPHRGCIVRNVPSAR